MKLVIAGSRNFNDYDKLRKDVNDFLNGGGHEIVSGNALGADKLGERYAMEYGFKITRFLPEYGAFGKRAPLIRNRQMAEYSNACICFWDGKSKGTKNMIAEAEKACIPLKVILI
jgi:hypothetical protein